jgi:pyruvate dehydrogenase E2 component (dihydrolipoamide acetyltransferase)
MAIDLMMPALSPTMEKGTLARWLVSVGDAVKPGDLLAEIETDKATMEYEAIIEGVISEIVIEAGTDDIPVGAVIARLGDIDVVPIAVKMLPPPVPAATRVPQEKPGVAPEPADDARSADAATPIDDASLSPLLRRILAAKRLDPKTLNGSGPNGKVMLADMLPATPQAVSPVSTTSISHRHDASGVAMATPVVPHEPVRLSNMRKTIARRLTESKQTVPHIYLTVDIRLDALLKLREQLNAALADRGVKLSVNDMMIKAQALALLAIPACNVQHTPEALIRFSRADIAVAVSIADGLITPVIVDAGSASLSAIATSMKELAARAREGKLQPFEYQGGTASLSNLGMFGIQQFDAVINPPQAMILAIGAGERRPVVNGSEIGIETVMTATGSFDHRAIDGADAAAFMGAFRSLVESPVGLIG